VLRGSRFSAVISLLFSPLTKIILGKDYSNRELRTETSMLLCANVLGLSNASTPIALSLMKKLDSKTNTPGASAVSVALSSCAPPSIIPMTVLSILYAGGFNDPLGLLPYVWICSSVSFLFSLVLGRLYRRWGRTE
jgi:spore maturation protein A